MAKILVVEDDPQMSRMYQRVFQLAGHEIQTAADGEEGLVKVKERTPELILLDIMMPKVNGMEVLSRLKADPQTADIPVIMLTNVSSGTLEAAQEAVAKKGAVKYIVKGDHTPQEVVTMTEEVLHG